MHSRFLSYFCGKCLKFYKIFRERLGGNKYPSSKKLNIFAISVFNCKTHNFQTQKYDVIMTSPVTSDHHHITTKRGKSRKFNRNLLSSCCTKLVSKWIKSKPNTKYIYLRQGSYVFAEVCLSVCLCVSKITQKVLEGSFWNFEGMSGMAKTTSDSILGVIWKESWIQDHFEIFVNNALNGA